MQNWRELETQIKLCKRCSLRSGCTQVVPGGGNPKAKIMFIGEGPGESEDREGIPFIGRSGKVLRQEIRRCGIDESDIFITNVVRCRPPNNRDPEPDEIEACWAWTGKILELIRPKIIVTLGAFPLSALAYRYGFAKKLGSRMRITAVAGKAVWVADRHFYVFPMVHPAFAMRSRVKRAEFSGHMKYLFISLPGWLKRPIRDQLRDPRTNLGP